MQLTDLIACSNCDLLHRKVPLEDRSAARCSRCGCVLYRRITDRVEPLAAVTLAALIMFALANLFPIVEFETQGITTSTTLPGAILLLWQEGRWTISLMVLCTAILFPLTELLAMLYLLIPLNACRRPVAFNGVLRVVLALRPWGMIEVFMLGTLVALIKLTSVAQMTAEPGLFAFGVLTLLVALIVSYDPRALWDIADARCRRPKPGPERYAWPPHAGARPSNLGALRRSGNARRAPRP